MLWSPWDVATIHGLIESLIIKPPPIISKRIADALCIGYLAIQFTNQKISPVTLQNNKLTANENNIIIIAKKHNIFYLSAETKGDCMKKMFTKQTVFFSL